MQNVELKAIQNYEKNLEFLSKEHPQVFKKLQAFDTAQEKGINVAKYDLEYINGYFDVKSIADNQFLYATDSLKYSQKIAQDVNYKKNSSLFSGLKEYRATPEQIAKIKEKNILTGSTIKDVLPIMNYAMKIAPDTTTMKKIDKFIFVGVGLGLHITTINEKIHSTEYLIIEDDLELFRLSLFTTPYFELAQHANLHFAISQKEMDFIHTMVLFLEGSFFNNRYIKYFHFPAHPSAKLKLIQNNLASQNHLTFPYDIQLQKNLRPLQRVKKGYKTLNLFTKFPDSVFSQKPMLVIAAGPSFKKNLDFVIKNQDRFIILAVSAVLKTLHDNGIKPDIVTHIDGIESEGNSCMIHFEGFNASEFLKDTLFVVGAHTPDSFLAMFNKEHIFFFEGATYYFNEFGTLSTPCVGSTSAILALWLNAKEIYLLGLDLALDQETGATHSSDHEYNQTHDLNKSNEIDYTISLRENIIPIKGNFRESVFSTPIFLISVRSIFGNVQALKDDSQHIYNLNDGAYLEQAIPIAVSKIDVNSFLHIDKLTLLDTLYETLNNRARNYFNEEELLSLHKRLENANQVLEYIKEYESKSFTNETEYLYDLLGLVSSLLKFKGREGNNISAVYASYFQYTLPYIVDIIYTKEITKIMKHIQKIDAMFIEGCYGIANTFIKEVESFFKE